MRRDTHSMSRRPQVHRPPRAMKPEQLWHLDLKDASVQEHERAEGLVLRRRRRPPHQRQLVQEGGDLLRPHLPRVPPVVKPDKRSDPVDMSFLGTRRVVPAAEGGSDRLDQGHGILLLRDRPCGRPHLSARPRAGLRPGGPAPSLF